MNNDFGDNAVPVSAGTKRRRDVENFGIITTELPNGTRLDGYTLLSAKNAAKLGIESAKLAELVKAQARAVIGVDGGVKLHIQFGDRELAVASPVAMTFVS